MMREFRIQAMMTLSDLISGPIAAIRQGFRATGNDADRLGKRIEVLGKRLAPFAIAAGLIIGGMAGTALATAETGEALGELATLGAKDLEMFRAKAMQVSNEWAGVTTPAFIRAAYDTKSALSSLSEQAQADITEMATITSIATKASVEDMTAFIGKAYNIMSKSASFEGLTDVQIAEQLFAGMSSAVKEFMTTGPAMKQSLMSMGNAATIAGIGVSDQLAALGQLNNVMEASVAGTGFKTFVNKLPQVSKELGLNFKDSAGKMLPLADILDRITNKIGGLESNAAQIKAIKLFGEDAANAFKSLAQKSDELRQQTATVGAAMKTGREYVVAMAKAANDNLGVNVKKMNQQISNAVQIVGSMFVPILSVAIQFISWLALGIQKVAGVIAGNPLLKWIVQVTAILALAFSMVGMFGALAAFMPGIITLVGGYAASMWTAATATLAATWPIYVLIGVIGLLVLAHKANFLGIGDTLRKWYGTVKLVFDGVRAVFASLKGRDFTITGDLADKLKAGGLVGIVTVIARTLYRLWQVMRGVGDVAITVGMAVAGLLLPAWKVLPSIIRTVVSVFGNLWDAVSIIISPIIRLLALLNPNVWRVIGFVIGAAVVAAFWPFFAMVAGVIAAVTVIIGVVWLLAKGFEYLAIAVKWVVKTTVDGWMMIGNLVIQIIGAYISTWSSIFGIFGGAYDFMVNGIKSVVDFLGSVNLFDAGRSLWQTFVDGMKSMAMAPVEAVKNVMEKVGRFFTHSDAKEGPLSTITSSGRSLMTTFASGVKSAAPALRAAVGVSLTGLMPMTAGANIGANGVTFDPVVVTVPAPEIVQQPIEILPARKITAEATPVEVGAPEVASAEPVEVVAPEVGGLGNLGGLIETPIPEVIPPAPVEVGAPEISQVEPMIPAAGAIKVNAPEVMVAGPEVMPPAPVEMGAPEIIQTPPVVAASPAVAVPAPEIIPAGVVALPAAQIEMTAPDLVAPGPVEVTAPAVSVVEAAPVAMPAPNIIPAAPVEMTAPEMVAGPAAEAPAFESTPLPEPVSRETIRETTKETVRTERTPATGGESRRYTITIQNLTLPGVKDAQTFVEQMSDYIDGHDGGNG